jgi:hypothetical protein
MDNVVFRGQRRELGNNAVYYEIEQEDGSWKRRVLPLFLDEVNHSPTGFEWGYGGSGPAQLAYAMLRVLGGEEFARNYYMQFKWDVISKIARDSWIITGEGISYWVRGIKWSK